MTIKLIIGMLVGGVLGFAAYRFIGCTTGTCPLTGNPWISTFLGLTLGTTFGMKPQPIEQNTKSSEQRESK